MTNDPQTPPSADDLDTLRMVRDVAYPYTPTPLLAALDTLIARVEQNTDDVLAENKRLKQFIYDIFVQCLNDFDDPYREDESHVETMKHCYDQINAFAQKMPDWGNWDYGFEAYCDGFEAGKKSVEKHHG